MTFSAYTNFNTVSYLTIFFPYNLGEKVLASSTNGRIPLTSLEETRLKEATQDRLNQEQLSELIDLVSQIHLKQIELEAEKTESMRKSLVETLPTNIEEETVENILCQWQMIQKRIFYYQEVAARSYFKFIKLNDGGKEQRVISATLRLLQVLFFKKSLNCLLVISRKSLLYTIHYCCVEYSQIFRKNCQQKALSQDY